MSWIAAIFEILGLWLLGGYNRFGFICFLVAELFWIYVGATTPQARGLVLVCAVLMPINAMGFYKWSRRINLTE